MARFETRNLRELPKFRDGLSYLYFEHGRIEQQDRSVALIPAPEPGSQPLEVLAVPAATLGVLMLGPGTTITHAAVKTLAENGCTVLWVGEDGQRFYAQGTGETRSAARLLKQASALATPDSRMKIVTRLYRMRFSDPLPPDLTLQQLRGKEGARVRDAYARLSHETGVRWQGRNYRRGDWSHADPINRAISAGNAVLYGVVHAAVVSMGFSPALGFIHTGKQLSFVYDIADLYKLDTVVPVAFTCVADGAQAIEARVRRALRAVFHEIRLLERISRDLLALFDVGREEADPWEADAAAPGALWDGDGRSVAGGRAWTPVDDGSSPEDETPTGPIQ